VDILRVSVTKSGHLSINYFLDRNYHILFLGTDFRYLYHLSINYFLDRNYHILFLGTDFRYISQHSINCLIDRNYHSFGNRLQVHNNLSVNYLIDFGHILDLGTDFT
jgi:uncharacterized protein YqgQ